MDKFSKTPLGPLIILQPKGVCLAGPLYENYHGKDGLRWDNSTQSFSSPCPYCITFMPSEN